MRWLQQLKIDHIYDHIELDIHRWSSRGSAHCHGCVVWTSFILCEVPQKGFAAIRFYRYPVVGRCLAFLAFFRPGGFDVSFGQRCRNLWALHLLDT